MTLAFLFGLFAGLIAYLSAGWLYEWYETGHLAVHRKMPVGPDAVTYSSDPVGFLIEFDLNLFLIAMGALGVLIAFRDILLETRGPQSLLLSLPGWHYANRTVSLFVGLGFWFFLIVLAFGLLHSLVSW